MASSAKRQILCVDSSADDCELLRFVLNEMGHAVETVQTLADGVRLAEQNRPDLYVLEAILIDGSGFDLLPQVRMFTPAAPVIICSADVRQATRQQADTAGVAAFFAKPVNLDALTAAISQLLGG